MADAKDQFKKPRIRKTAPSLREAIEASQAKASKASEKSRPKLPKVNVKLPGARGISRVASFLAPRYLINAWRELRQVVWPSRKETWRLTLAVFVFALVFGALVAGVDKALDEIFKKVVLK